MHMRQAATRATTEGWCGRVSQTRAAKAQEITRSSCSEWWAVLGSNQWPLPCETEVWGLQINDMRDRFPVATRTCYHVISLDITQRHDRTVPKLSQRPHETLT